MANSEYYKKYRDKRKSLGLCRQCNNKVCNRSKTFCEKCLERNNRLTKASFEKLDPMEKRHRILKKSSKQRKLDYLNLEEFKEWDKQITKSCFYCSVVPEEIHESRKKTLTIDRKDNSIGYIFENMCYCCNRCNILKSNFFTESEWSEIAEKYIKPRIKEYHGFDAKYCE